MHLEGTHLEIDSFSEEALPECREKTFKKWPFKQGPCTAKEMAKAGFYHKKQTISCYYCFKELEGWESTDIPFEEHKKHAPYCCFIKRFEQAPETLTDRDVIELEKGRIHRKLDMAKDEVLYNIDLFRDSIMKRFPDQKKRGRKGVK